jgi:hypothetical protein
MLTETLAIIIRCGSTEGINLIFVYITTLDAVKCTMFLASSSNICRDFASKFRSIIAA